VELGEPRVFCGDPARQISDAPFPGGGRIIAINNLVTALAALDEIVEQGEGARHVEVWDGDCDDMHPGREQVAHYYRFQELQHGRRYRRGDTPQSGPTGDIISIDWGGVRPVRPNPRSSDHAPGSAIRRAQEQFNQSYCAILRLLDQAFNGSPQTLRTAIGSMYRLKVQAQALMEMPTEDGMTTAGPTFEYIPQQSAGGLAVS
jgi:ferritin-like protein